jgi:hypothetical protein
LPIKRPTTPPSPPTPISNLHHNSHNSPSTPSYNNSSLHKESNDGNETPNFSLNRNRAPQYFRYPSQQQQSHVGIKFFFFQTFDYSISG